MIVDDVAGVQVWNKPFYGYRWKVEEDPEHDYILNVKAEPKFVRHRDAESNKASGEEDRFTTSYVFRLYIDREDQRDGAFRVIAGQWTQEYDKRGNLMIDSGLDHPDTVMVPVLSSKTLGSYNKAFNKNVQYVQDFIRQ